MDQIPGEQAAAYKQMELKCIYFALNVCAIPSLNVPPQVYLFTYFYVREWGKKANNGETEMEMWNSAAQIPPDTS